MEGRPSYDYHNRRWTRCAVAVGHRAALARGKWRGADSLPKPRAWLQRGRGRRRRRHGHHPGRAAAGLPHADGLRLRHRRHRRVHDGAAGLCRAQAREARRICIHTDRSDDAADDPAPDRRHCRPDDGSKGHAGGGDQRGGTLRRRRWQHGLARGGRLRAVQHGRRHDVDKPHRHGRPQGCGRHHTDDRRQRKLVSRRGRYRQAIARGNRRTRKGRPQPGGNGHQVRQDNDNKRGRCGYRHGRGWRRWQPGCSR